MIGRLESKGWVDRFADPVDRRRKLLVLTPDGQQALSSMQSAVVAIQAEILSPLTPQEQGQFMQLLSRLVTGHEAA